MFLSLSSNSIEILLKVLSRRLTQMPSQISTVSYLHSPLRHARAVLSRFTSLTSLSLQVLPNEQAKLVQAFIGTLDQFATHLVDLSLMGTSPHIAAALAACAQLPLMSLSLQIERANADNVDLDSIDKSLALGFDTLQSLSLVETRGTGRSPHAFAVPLAAASRLTRLTVNGLRLDERNVCALAQATQLRSLTMTLFPISDEHSLNALST